MKNKLNFFLLGCKTFLAISLVASCVGIYGDDTEVFYSVNVSKPNLLFVLDVSGSMSTRVAAASGQVTLQQTITYSGDDAVQEGSRGRVNRTSGSININANRQTSSARFRFVDIDIPQGKVISKAYIQFEAAASDNSRARFSIYSEASNNAPRDISSHWGNSYYSGPVWDVNNRWSSGDRGLNQRVDVTSVTQQVINRGGWSANNSIAYYIDSSRSERSVATFDSSTRSAPVLFIEYADAKDRLEVMQESLRQVLKDAPDNVKVGLMNYGLDSINPEVNNNYPERRRHHSVSGITFPVTDINAKVRDIVPTNADVYGLPSFPSETITIREYIADIADSWNHNSFTPIVDALYEAALYFRGEKIHYGQNLPTINGAHPSTYDGAPVTTNVHTAGRDRASAPNYISPIESSCQENYIVLMTDGAPTYRYDANNNGQWESGAGPFALLRNTVNGPQGALASAIASCATAAGVGIQGNCGAEITEYIATNDNLGDPTSSFPNGQPGNQFIKTFAVGFGTGAGTSTEAYLKSLATYDDGNTDTDDDGYFLASSPEELAAAFAKILEEVSSPKGTLASPGYSVNVKNGLEHEKDIFIPVFDRKNTSRWSGNLKKFKLVDVGEDRVIRGANGVNATDELGNFTFDALDYWSTSTIPDGRDVQKGGVANLLDPSTRKIFSNLTGNTNVSLSVGNANKLHLDNIANLKSSTLGLPADATLDYRKKIVSFMRGWKNGVTDSSAIPPPEKRFHMGDMLHSEPLVMTYNKGSGANSTGKQQYIFAGTNEGYLHAIDADTGEEKFAFIPAELLRTISEPQFLNSGTQKDHKYGVDGGITGDFIGGKDGVLNSGDQIIIYFGLRRGGSAYYALDVTDINNPVLLWKKSDEEHLSMGQSWSTPYVATVGDSTTDGLEVVMVSGGYDEDEDRDKADGSGEVEDSTVNVTADVGNDIFIFDAKLGTKIWSMPKEFRDQITSSIAGGIRPLDTNNNNLIDRIYFGDTGGNVWRLDISEDFDDSSIKPDLTKLASLGGSGINNRMFFNEPDVALMKLNGRSVYAVSIGSGFRAHPMDTVIDDKFYVVIDKSPYNPIDKTGSNPFKEITESDLATVEISATGAVKTTDSIVTGKLGWIMSLPEKGEKVLGDATAINGSIIFTTLVPEVLSSGSGIDQCAAPVTYSRLFAIDILTGTAKWPLGIGDTPAPFTEPLTSEIIDLKKVFNTPKPNSPVKPLIEGGPPTGEFECIHTVDLRVGKKSSQVTGYNACRLDSVYWSDPVEVGQ